MSSSPATTKYDDEGVKARRIDVVENGVFKNFLDVALADRRVRPLERTRPRPARLRTRGATVEPRRPPHLPLSRTIRSRRC